MSEPAAAVLALNRKLLAAIVAGDWATYADLCAPGMTCLEPEALGHVAVGLDFHKFYFDLPPSSPGEPVHAVVSMADVHIHATDHMAVLAYIRLNQRSTGATASTTAVEETRVWQKLEGGWKLVHTHRSPCSTAGH